MWICPETSDEVERGRLCSKTWPLESSLPGLDKIMEKVYLKSQILVHEYWTILDHFCVPVL